MIEQFNLKTENPTIADEDRGFCLSYPESSIAYRPPKLSGGPHATAIRKAITKIAELVGDFDQEQLVQTAPVIVQNIAQKLSKGEDLSDMIEPEYLDKLLKRVEKLSPSQRELLDFGMDDFVTPKPLLCNVTLQKKRTELYANFFIYDIAVYQVQKLTFVKPELDRGKISLSKAGKLTLNDYKFPLPRQIITNIILTRQLKPTVSDDYFISMFNVLIAP